MSTIKVRRGAKIIRTTENELEKYITKGYEIIDGGKGSEVEATQPEVKKEPAKQVRRNRRK